MLTAKREQKILYIVTNLITPLFSLIVREMNLLSWTSFFA